MTAEVRERDARDRQLSARAGVDDHLPRARGSAAAGLTANPDGEAVFALNAISKDIAVIKKGQWFATSKGRIAGPIASEVRRLSRSGPPTAHYAHHHRGRWAMVHRVDVC